MKSLAAVLLSLALCSAASPALRAQAVQPVAPPLTHITITTEGNGAPVLLMPGLATPRAVYSGVAEKLAPTHRSYLVQVDGFAGGDPGANLAPGMLEGIVLDLHAYIVANHLQGTAFVGHSMGGLVGLMLVKEHPEDVGRLMIVDSLPYIGDLFLPGAQVAQVEPQAKMMRDAMNGTYGKPADTGFATMTAKGLALHEDSRAKVAAWVAQSDPRVSGEALYEDMTTDLRPALAGIKTPITLVYPYGGPMPQQKADAFYHAEYAAAPHITYVPVGDSAHFVMLDQPLKFDEAVAAFLAAK